MRRRYKAKPKSQGIDYMYEAFKQFSVKEGYSHRYQYKQNQLANCLVNPDISRSPKKKRKGQIRRLDILSKNIEARKQRLLAKEQNLEQLDVSNEILSREKKLARKEYRLQLKEKQIEKAFRQISMSPDKTGIYSEGRLCDPTATDTNQEGASILQKARLEINKRQEKVKMEVNPYTGATS